MWLVLLIFGIILIAAFSTSGAKNKKRASGTHPVIGTAHHHKRPAYRRRYRVMNASEQAFFHELRKQLPPAYHIFPNMRIADFIDAEDGEGFYRRRNAILPKHIDFLVCDNHFRPLHAIEVNGDSHRHPDRISRDKLVTQIFAEAKLPLTFVNVGQNFAQEITRLKETLEKHRGAQTH